jgi:hypothetical protein
VLQDDGVRGTLWRELALPFAVVCALSCERPIHPNNPAIPEELCRPRCQREHDCDATVDVVSCINYCEHGLSPRAVYDREDVVTSLRACAQGQGCVADVDRAISTCQVDVMHRLEPSVSDRTFCHRMVERSFKCGDYRWDEDHCVLEHKMYSDAILGQLTDCLDQPCPRYRRCMIAVVGPDMYWEDRDRIAQAETTPVPPARPASVVLEAKVVTDPGAPIADATICLQGPEGPCVQSSASGAVSLGLPAHAEIAISVKATGFGDRLVPITTTGADLRDWTITLLPKAILHARYATLGAPYPDDSAGFIFATAQAPKGSPVGLEGVTMEISPRSGRGPVFFTPGSDPDPDRKATSTWSSGLFARVQPGEVTLTFGPETVSCVPLDGGWPSPRPNSVRIPVVAGYETRIRMRCHK